MKFDGLLTEYKDGELSLAELKQKLRQLKAQVSSVDLSEGQKGLWALQKTFPTMAAYNIPLCFRVQHLDVTSFVKACRFLLRQHPIFSSVIKEQGITPAQWLHSVEDVDLEQLDISQLDEKQLHQRILQQVNIPFVLERGPLLRVRLMHQADEQCVVLIVVHHIVFDGSSVAVLLDSLLQSYSAYTSGEQPKLIPHLSSYSAFVHWEKEMLDSKRGQAHLNYWKRQLSAPLPVLSLTTDKPRAALGGDSVDGAASEYRKFRGAIYSRSLPEQLNASVTDFVAARQIDFSVLFLSIFKLLLYRYSDQDDIIVGVPTMGRPKGEFDQLIGYFINMIALRSRGMANKTFTALLQQVRMTMIDGLDHAVYPFPRLVRELPRELSQELHRESTRESASEYAKQPAQVNNSSAPVFQVMFAYQNFSLRSSLQKLQQGYSKLPALEPVEGIHQTGEYELSLEVFSREPGFELVMKYDPDLYEPATIAGMMDAYINLMQEVLAAPDLPLTQYSLVNREQQASLLRAWNNTRQDYPDDACIHRLFSQQADKTPKAIALVYQDEQLSYRELERNSNQLALYLQALGIGSGNRVAVCMERSLQLPVALLGVLKSGAAYVPLDPDYPESRLQYMLQDSGAVITLTQQAIKHRLDSLLREDNSLVLDNHWQEIERSASEIKSDLPDVAPSKLAYVIYTSGSTGQPKGVMVTHRNVVNFLSSMKREPGINSGDRLLAVTTISFDIAGLELYLPLLNGAVCHLCPSRTSKDAEKLRNEISTVKPSLMQATPSTWTMLYQLGWRNDEQVKVLCGGEPLTDTLRRQFIQSGTEAWNMYGPTETTIWSTLQRIDATGPITIGKPIANTQVFILDEQLKQVGIGVTGELCIGGDGVAGWVFKSPRLNRREIYR